MTDMDALTDDQLAYLVSELGTDVDQDDLQDRYDRLGDATAVAAEVIRQRLADLIAEGPGLSIPGVITEQGKGDFIKALQAQASRLEVTGSTTVSAVTSGRLVRSDRSR